MTWPTKIQGQWQWQIWTASKTNPRDFFFTSTTISVSFFWLTLRSSGFVGLMRRHLVILDCDASFFFCGCKHYVVQIKIGHYLFFVCHLSCRLFLYYIHYILQSKKIKRFVYLKFNSICIRNAIMTLWLYNKLGNCEFRLLQISACNVNRLLFVNTDSPLFTDCQIIFFRK